MKFTPTEIPEVILIEPDVHQDARGFFLETYHQEKYAAGGIPGPFVQDNHSHSLKGTLRGLHAQTQRPQGKLVRAVLGEMFDVAVDVRRGSPTFGRWVGVTLSGRELPPALHPARLRPRLLRAVRAGRRRVQVHRLLRAGRRDHGALERSRRSASPGR